MKARWRHGSELFYLNENSTQLLIVNPARRVEFFSIQWRKPDRLFRHTGIIRLLPSPVFLPHLYSRLH
ncbi:hypothetical protein FRUB_09893 [Fimbriiglobus ruber]|uniref:Uncharacterized protein n=1 Tax=Fimbriiglobus ruber TaxID=1908690 RepID=A0A225D0C7_9BACT|nr:hypothetical protein FRUB_09893 [Fimbriiglobus ruber]